MSSGERKLIAREPTQAMLISGWRGAPANVSHELAADIWRAMWDAAPAEPAPQLPTPPDFEHGHAATRRLPPRTHVQETDDTDVAWLRTLADETEDAASKLLLTRIAYRLLHTTKGAVPDQPAVGVSASRKDIPHTVPSPHTDAGCRVGGRFDAVDALRARVEELEQERDDAISDLKLVESVTVDAALEATRLAEAERDAALKDAERYRWLRTRRKMADEIDQFPSGHLAVNQSFRTWGQALYESDADAAIDVALAREEKPK